jgi:hypothetical protein
VLRDQLAAALAEAPRLGGLSARAQGVQLGTLARLSGAEICGQGDRMAGILARFSGGLDQVALFAMETEHALALVHGLAQGEDPLAAYTTLGQGFLEAVTRAIDPIDGAQVGDATLHEETALQALLGTHAPSDTVVVSIGLDLLSERVEGNRPAHVYVLAEPKPFRALRTERLVPGSNQGILTRDGHPG